MDPQTELIRLSSSQYSVFTSAQAAERGVSRRTIDRMVAFGLLIRIHRGVFVFASTTLGWQQRVMAACLACAPHAAASFGSAAAIWGLAEAVDRPHVTVPANSHKKRPGIVIHRTDRFEVTRRKGFPVTPPMRTLLDLGEIYPEELLERTVDNAHRQGWIEMTRMEAYLDRPEHQAVPGSGVLREIVVGRTPGRPVGSDLESILFHALRKVGLPLPVKQHPVETANGFRFIDFAYPEAKLAIELEGFEQHGLKRDVFEDDRLRFDDLRDLGWHFRQFTWKMTKPDPVGAAIRVGRALGLVPSRWKRL